MARQSYAFRVAGIEPRYDPEWHAAGEAVHRAFWRAVVGFVLAAKDTELAAGKDRFGVPMVAIAESTRRKGRWRSHTGEGTADNPPLDPAGAISRTRNLFTGRAHRDHAEFFWRVDDVTGKHWGKILGCHRAGAGRLPVRDVIGISGRSLERVKRRADQWWADWKKGRAHEERAREFRVELPRSARPVPVRPVGNRLVAGGRIDVENFTFGIGSAADGAAEFRQAIAAGTTTGFRQLPRWRPPEGGGGVAAAPRPRPRPDRPRPPARQAARVPVAPIPIKPPVAPAPPPRPPEKPRAPAPATFGPSRATVTVSDPNVFTRLKQITGRDFTPEDIASLVGATHDAQVEAHTTSWYGLVNVKVEITGPRYHSSRTIQIKDGKPVIHNDILVVERPYRGAGLGAQILGRQVEHASKWGFDRLETDAARSEGPDGYVGYYAWPRLGYNAPIPPEVKRKLPESMRDAVTVRDLMKTQERRDWWKTHGVWTNGMIFNLQPGTDSMNDLQANLSESRTKKTK